MAEGSLSVCVELQSHSLSSERAGSLRRSAPTQNRAASSPFSPFWSGVHQAKGPPGSRAGGFLNLHDHCRDLGPGNSPFAGTTLPAEQEAEGGEAERRRAALLSSPVANGCLVPHFPLSFLTPRRREPGLGHAPLGPPRSQPAGGRGGAADQSRPGRGRGSSRGQRGREASAGPGAAGGERAEGSHRPPLPLPRPPTLLPSPGGSRRWGARSRRGRALGVEEPGAGVCVRFSSAAPPAPCRRSSRGPGAPARAGRGARRSCEGLTFHPGPARGGAAFLPGCWGGASTFHLESLDVPPEPGAGGRGAGPALGLRGRPATRMRIDPI